MASEHAEVIICGWCTKKGLVRSAVLKCFGGVEVEEVSGGAQGFSPICRRHGGLEKQSAHDVINGSNDPFGLAVLLGCVRT